MKHPSLPFARVLLLPVAVLMLFSTNLCLAQSSSNSPGTTGTPTPVPSSTPTPSVTPSPTPTPSPTITRSEALAQAQQQVPDVPTVYDITDPAVVYGVLREGVDAWRASLGVNTDQWGIQITPVYVTSVRPDVVPASLQSFLLQHYAGNPTIALAMGPDGVSGTMTQLQQEHDRNVNELADNIYGQAVQEAEELAQQQAQDNNNPSDDSENVPPLDDSGDNNGGNDNPPAEAPRIASISPSTIILEAGSTPTLDISGENFGSDASAVTIDFSNGSTGLSPSSVSDTSISVELPDDFIANKTISVTVKVGEQTSNAVNISATPSIVSINPEELLDQETLTIYGYGFDHSTAENNTLTFTGAGSPVNLKPSSCTFDSGKRQAVLTITVGADDVGGTGQYSLAVSTNGQESQAVSVTFTSSADSSDPTTTTT